MRLRSLAALAEGVGPAPGRSRRPMGAWAGECQRPSANMDNARFLDQSFLSHEFINSKPLGVGGARVLQDACQDPPNAWAIAAKNDEPSAFRVG
jgi:hypothetical protein